MLQELARKKKIKMLCITFRFTSWVRREDAKQQQLFDGLVN
jgi:hypothetical protein